MSTVSFKGNIGKVRPVQLSNDGQPRLSFSVGESHGRFNKQSNQWEDTGTTWWNVTVFGKDAEALSEVLQEGAKQRVAVSGRAQTREYESNGERRTSLDVIADVVGIIPKAQQGGQQWQQSQPAADSWTAPAADPWATGGGFGGQGTTEPAPF